MDALTGIGPGRDTTSAMDYFRKSADLGYPPAQISLGYYYEVGGLIAADPAQAVEWYKKAAKQDDRRRDWVLGGCTLAAKHSTRLAQGPGSFATLRQSGRPVWTTLTRIGFGRARPVRASSQVVEKAANQGLPRRSSNWPCFTKTERAFLPINSSLHLDVGQL